MVTWNSAGKALKDEDLKVLQNAKLMLGANRRERNEDAAQSLMGKKVS